MENVFIGEKNTPLNNKPIKNLKSSHPWLDFFAFVFFTEKNILMKTQEKEMKIREAVQDDFDAFFELNKEVQDVHRNKFPETFKELDVVEVKSCYSKILQSNTDFLFFAYDEKEILGYILLKCITIPENPYMFERKRFEIDQLCVTQKKRKKGIGKTLIEYAISLAKQKGIAHIELCVWSENTVAKTTFEKLGFNTYFERKKLSL